VQVLEQHKLAGIMLRKELKAQKKKLERKQEMDARVASHHRKDNDFPPCHTYKSMPPDPKRKSLLTVGTPSPIVQRPKSNSTVGLENALPVSSGTSCLMKN